MVLLQVLTAVFLAKINFLANCPEIISRNEWGARPATEENNLTHPVSYVVIHHTYQPGFCDTREECISAMQSIQQLHQDVNHWADIGYNFAIGGDGAVYEGRGWNLIGAHAPRYNYKSIGIVFIGDFTTQLPTLGMLETAQKLINCGVINGIIHPNYNLIGHRQVRTTECPGDALFGLLQTWSHWVPLWDIPDTNTTEPPIPVLKGS